MKPQRLKPLAFQRLVHTARSPHDLSTTGAFAPLRS